MDINELGGVELNFEAFFERTLQSHLYNSPEELEIATLYKYPRDIQDIELEIRDTEDIEIRNADVERNLNRILMTANRAVIKKAFSSSIIFKLPYTTFLFVANSITSA